MQGTEDELLPQAGASRCAPTTVSTPRSCLLFNYILIHSANRLLLSTDFKLHVGKVVPNTPTMTSGNPGFKVAVNVQNICLDLCITGTPGTAAVARSLCGGAA